ncbi:hypothetical protein O181_014170 [Austropuccinia psidii MF-1]|uniref:Uncharacterized protein n=1 Tax=Austropuccinia psidii MF-1 TaxID=1389203 RepID=A0A9Q3C0G2_9BASI|nr:hypothetical protein [Austropuccinia psidii MF-1]
MNRDPKYDTIRPLEKKSSIILEDGMDQVQNKGMIRRIKKEMETVLEEGKLVESEDDLILDQQNNANWEHKFDQGRRFEELEEEEISENTQRLAGLTIQESNLKKK